MISEAYKEQLEEKHRTGAGFGKSGHRWAAIVKELAEMLETQDVLDYGCGKGELNLHMPYQIKQYDPAVPKFSATPQPADIVVCTDVLEHVEPEYTDAVLADLERVTKKKLLLNISSRMAEKTLPDGRNTHLVVEDAFWWIRKLTAWRPVTLNANLNELTCVLEPIR